MRRGWRLAIILCLAACMVGHDEGILASPSQGRKKVMGCLLSGQKLAASGASVGDGLGSGATTETTTAAANSSAISLNVKERTRRLGSSENEKQPQVAENGALPRRVRRARVRKPLQEGGDVAWSGNNKGELSRLEDFRKFVELLGLRSRTTDEEIDSCFAKASNGTLGVLNFTECASAVGHLASSLGIQHILPTHWGPNVLRPLPPTNHPFINPSHLSIPPSFPPPSIHPSIHPSFQRANYLLVQPRLLLSTYNIGPRASCCRTTVAFSPWWPSAHLPHPLIFLAKCSDSFDGFLTRYLMWCLELLQVRAIPVWRLLRMAPRKKGSWGERRWNRPCMESDCSKLPSFGVFGTASPEFCRTHAPPGYFDLR